MEKNQLDDLIRKGAELARRHEEIHDEITRQVLENPLIPEDFKDFVRRQEENRELERAKGEFERKLNEGRKIIGWDPETFNPIYEEGNANG